METQHEFTCAHCKEHKIHVNPHGNGGTGYGVLNGEKVCYACCGLIDTAQMLSDGKGVMYLVRSSDGTHKVTNWPGTLSVKVDRVKMSNHNMVGRNGRTDVWFTWQGCKWHGVNIGEQQLCRVRRVKR